MLYGYLTPGMSADSLINQAVAEGGNASFIAPIPSHPRHTLVSASAWDSVGYELEPPSRSPINQLNSLKAKVMLVVGGKDQRVPEIQGLHLHQALLDRHIAHQWLLKPDEIHGFYDEANANELYTRMLQFIGANIGPGVAGTAVPVGTTTH